MYNAATNACPLTITELTHGDDTGPAAEIMFKQRIGNQTTFALEYRPHRLIRQCCQGVVLHDKVTCPVVFSTGFQQYYTHISQYKNN
jgi:hypothetical protein